MEIKFSKSAKKNINVMDKTTKDRIKQGIVGLILSPPKGDIKQLQGYTGEVYRLRIGKYRIIYKYTVDNSIEILYIIDIGGRGDIYK